MASFLSRVFRNRSLSRASSFRSSEPSLNDSSRQASSSAHSRATTKLSSSASVGNLGSYTIDPRELERNKLHKAAWTGKLKKVQRLARAGQVNLRDSQSRTPIHLAVVKGNVEVVRYLIEQGARLDMQDVDGRTPLAKAILSGVQNPELNLEICRTLIEGNAGDFINQKDKRGKTALHSAIEHAHENLVYLLLSTGNCDLNLQDRDQMTPLHLAIKRNNPRLIVALVSADHGSQIDPNITNQYGQTPLHLAASMGYDDIVRELLLAQLDQPCDPTLTDNNDLTAYDLAKKNHHETCAKLIEEYQEKFGKRPLARGISMSVHEASSLKATTSISMTPQPNREHFDDETDDDSSSSSMDSQRPVVRQTLKRSSDQWSDENLSSIVTSVKPQPKSASHDLQTQKSISSVRTNSQIAVQPALSNKKTKTSEPAPPFFGIAPAIERMDSDQTTSRSGSTLPVVNHPTAKKTNLSSMKSWSDDTLSQPPKPILTKKTTDSSDRWDSTSVTQSDDEDITISKPKAAKANLQSTQPFPAAESDSDNESFETEIRRMDDEKHSTGATGYKVIGPHDQVSQKSEPSSSWTSPVKATSTSKVIQTLVTEAPLFIPRDDESPWDDSRPVSAAEERPASAASVSKSEPKSSNNVIGKLLVTPLTGPKEEEHSSGHLPYDRTTMRPSISSINSSFHDARVNELKESIKKLEQNYEDNLDLKRQLREMKNREKDLEDRYRQQDRQAREFEQKYQQEKIEKQQLEWTTKNLNLEVKHLKDQLRLMEEDNERLNERCLQLKEERNQYDEKLRELQMKLLQNEDVPRRIEVSAPAPPPTRPSEELEKAIEEKNFYQQEYERIKLEKEQLYHEKTQIKLKYDGLLEEIRVILLDRSQLEQQLTTELQERMEQRQRAKEELQKYQLQIAEVNQKLADAQARLVVLQSHSPPAPPVRTPSLPNVTQTDENYLADHGEHIRTETARMKTELDRLRGDFDRIVSTYEPSTSMEQYAQIHSHIDIFRQFYEQEFRQRKALRSKLNTSLPISPAVKEARLTTEDLLKTIPSVPRNASALLSSHSLRTFRDQDHF